MISNDMKKGYFYLFLKGHDPTTSQNVDNRDWKEQTSH